MEFIVNLHPSSVVYVHLIAPRGARQVTSNVPLRKCCLEHTALILILGLCESSISKFSKNIAKLSLNNFNIHNNASNPFACTGVYLEELCGRPV